MEISTILVHLADDDHNHQRLGVAWRLARHHDAHLVGLFITTPLGLASAGLGRGASAVLLEEAVKAARKRAETLRQEYEDFCDSHSIGFEWIVEEGDHLDLLARHAHTADLIVTSQPVNEHLEDYFRLRLPEELVMTASIPVLMVPVNYERDETVGKSVLVAWKGSREAVRAVRNALGIMKKADKVVVVTVGPSAEDALSETAIVGYLRRHGIEAEARNVDEGEDGVSKTLLDVASDEGSDLIVMGAYGHSRLREVVMGGVTRRLLRDSPLPLFMTH